MSIQTKKTFAILNFKDCDPGRCDPENGVCAAVAACAHKVIYQIDGVFEQPMINQNLCQGCWDCMDACPLDAIQIKNIGS